MIDIEHFEMDMIDFLAGLYEEEINEIYYCGRNDAACRG